MSKRRKEIPGSHRHLYRQVRATFEEENECLKLPKPPELNLSTQDSEAKLVAIAGLLGAITGRVAWGLSDRIGTVSLSFGLEVALVTLLLGLPLIYKERDNKLSTAREKLTGYEQFLESREQFLILVTASRLRIPTNVAKHILSQSANASI